MLFGAVTICFLFLGLPAYMDKIVAILCGLAIIFIALRLRPEPVKVKKVPYVDHKSTGDIVQDVHASQEDTVTNTEATNIINTENK